MSLRPTARQLDWGAVGSRHAAGRVTADRPNKLATHMVHYSDRCDGPAQLGHADEPFHDPGVAVGVGVGLAHPETQVCAAVRQSF
ncbi:MAG TPA: hypothetical protein VMW17_18740 [Candidatus Binatia bacterium]|nr:hypothetical protein [Candidatus Binatia bacterium]